MVFTYQIVSTSHYQSLSLSFDQSFVPADALK